MNTKVELRILRSFSSGQEEIMDDQENDTHSEVAKEDWPHPWSKDEAKKRSNMLQLWGYTSWRFYILFLRKFMLAFEFKVE